MRVPYSWLQEYVDVNLPPHELAKQLTSVGVAVETVEALGQGIEGVTIGHVKQIERHPNSDHLWVCHVDLGTRELTILTGAQNVRQGDKVPAAVPGSRIPTMEQPLGVVNMRGIDSNGMLCSAEELGLPLEDNDGIMILPPDAPVGGDVRAYLGLSDTVLELDLTVNYATHCQAMVGVAQEVAAWDGQSVRWPSPRVEEAEGHDIHDQISITIAAEDLCPRYTARMVRNVKIGTSPAWLQARLRAAGMRPINNVVDITNFVMLELGQPLHAFDYDRLQGKQIIVRRAQPGELMTTLDKQERRLDSEVLVIADSQHPVAMAGVMGGFDSEVTDQTTTILLESAIFHAINNRRTARRFNLPSEAASRYTKGVDPSGVLRAADRAVALMAELCGGEVVPGTIDVIARPAVPTVVVTRPSRVSDLIGVELTSEQMQGYLEELGFGVCTAGDLALDAALGLPPGADGDAEGDETGEGEDLAGRAVLQAMHMVSPVPQNPEAYATWLAAAVAELERAAERLIEGEESLAVVVPTRRLDVEAEIDIVEEVARAHGFDNIPATLPKGATQTGGRPPRQDATLRARRALAGMGLVEIMTHSLIHPKVFDKLGLPADDGRRAALTLQNPLYEERSVLRNRLLPGMLDVLAYNVSRSQRDVAAFEVSHVYLPVAGQQLPLEPLRVGIALLGNVTTAAWNSPERPADFYSLKGYITNLLDQMNVVNYSIQPSSNSLLHPGRQAELVVDGQVVGSFGELHPKVAANWDLPGRVYVAELDFDPIWQAAQELRTYTQVSRFPAVQRDVALVVVESLPASTVEQALVSGAAQGNAQLGGAPVAVTFSLFDVYTGEHVAAGQRSLAYSITYQPVDRTLTDSDLDRLHGAVRAALTAVGAQLRS